MGRRADLEDATGLALPFMPTFVSYDDNGEGRLRARIKLSANQVRELRRDSRFTPGDGLGQLLPRDKDIYLVPFDYSTTFPHGVVPLAAESCGPGSHVVTVLDESQGDLWIAVGYVDMAGDPPPGAC